MGRTTQRCRAARKPGSRWPASWRSISTVAGRGPRPKRSAFVAANERGGDADGRLWDARGRDQPFPVGAKEEIAVGAEALGVRRDEVVIHGAPL
jgi:hypothetical protein